MLALLGLSSLCAIAFVVVYALDRSAGHDAVPRAVARASRSCSSRPRLIVAGQGADPRGGARRRVPAARASGRAADDRAARRRRQSTGSRGGRLLKLGLLGAGGALGLAAITPALSFGPASRDQAFVDDAVAQGPAARRRDRSAVEARPTSRRSRFYTAFPEGADKEELRRPARARAAAEAAARTCPAMSRGYDADGIVAYSKICTHAGCAISMYRVPLFQPDRADAGARLPVPLLDVRPGDRRHAFSSGRPGANLPMLPVARRREGLPARRGELQRRRSGRRGGASASRGRIP